MVSCYVRPSISSLFQLKLGVLLHPTLVTLLLVIHAEYMEAALFAYQNILSFHLLFQVLPLPRDRISLNEVVFPALAEWAKHHEN